MRIRMAAKKQDMLMMLVLSGVAYGATYGLFELLGHIFTPNAGVVISHNAQFMALIVLGLCLFFTCLLGFCEKSGSTGDMIGVEEREGEHKRPESSRFRQEANKEARVETKKKIESGQFECVADPFGSRKKDDAESFNDNELTAIEEIVF